MSHFGSETGLAIVVQAQGWTSGFSSALHFEVLEWGEVRVCGA